MAIADRKLVGIRTKALQERARTNENNKRAAAMVRYLRGTEVVEEE